jgi:hypothetical protein
MQNNTTVCSSITKIYLLPNFIFSFQELALQTNKIKRENASRSQIKIHLEQVKYVPVRNRLGLKTGDKFLVMGNKNVVILKILSNPSLLLQYWQMIILASQ